jgi:hypothetical protein
MRVILFIVLASAIAWDDNLRERRSRGAGGSVSWKTPERSLKGFRSGSSDNASHKSGKGRINKGSKSSGTSSECKSNVANEIMNVKEAMTINPERCCDNTGPTAVIITHAQWDPTTPTGLEPYWNSFYYLLDEYTEIWDVCFVLTGVNQTASEETRKSMSNVLMQINSLVAILPNVPAMMSTNPTTDVKLVQLFRTISDTADATSIGGFNAGYAQIIAESAVSGKEPLPYIGVLDDESYGVNAATLTLQLLNEEPVVPLCFNARPDLSYVGERCAAYYNTVTNGSPPDRSFGVTCRSDSSVDAVLALLLDRQANALFSHVDCCRPVTLAATKAMLEYNQTIVVGCQDDIDTIPPASVNFVTTQPIELQAYQVASWVSLPVVEATERTDGRDDTLFPSLQSLVNAAVFNVVVF